MKEHVFLNLGAGVQSGAIYCLMVDGDIPPADVAIFSDTQDEPPWVYDQLEYCKQQAGPPIVEVTAGRIGDDLQFGRNSTGRFASIPAHTAHQEGKKGGLTRRQCTREYKIDPIEKWIRYEFLGLKPKQRIPKDVHLTNLFGFSTDESDRAVRMRMQHSGKSRWDCDFPLMHEHIWMSRRDATQYIEERSGFTWKSSRCVFCPLQSNKHWREIKTSKEAWDRATFIDNALRTTGSVANRNMNESMYVHSSCIPLGKATLDEGQGTLFEDDGGCDQGCFL